MQPSLGVVHTSANANPFLLSSYHLLFRVGFDFFRVTILSPKAASRYPLATSTPCFFFRFVKSKDQRMILMINQHQAEGCYSKIRLWHSDLWFFQLSCCRWSSSSAWRFASAAFSASWLGIALGPSESKLFGQPKSLTAVLREQIHIKQAYWIQLTTFWIESKSQNCTSIYPMIFVKE